MAAEVSGTRPGWTPQFQLWDAGSGPSRDMWSMHLGLPWKNRNSGDWIDAAGVRQGTTPYAKFAVVGASRVYEVDITPLATRWLPIANNRGAMLRGEGFGWAIWAGRLSSTPPLLMVTTDQGTFSCTGMACLVEPTTYRSLDTRYSAQQKPWAPLLVQFDLKAVRGTVQRAVMRLTCQASSSSVLNVSVYEIDPPRFQLGSNGAKVHMGLAANGEAALKSHASVIRAGDFSDLTPGVLFDEYIFNTNNPYQTLPDPDAPGTTMFRGCFTPAANHSFNGRVETMRADMNNPLRPPRTLTEELYCRMYVYLEDDWNSALDANKMAIGWDMRMGWWNDAGRGYWQSTTGNGGSPGTGKKFFRPRGTIGAIRDTYEYQGHSVRMEAGKSPGDGNPYSHLRPLQSYIYSLDQPTAYGQMARLGSGVISKNRWHCLEQRLKINSVTGPFDEMGNGVAVPDGEMDTWLDGVLVSQVRGLRWRCNNEMGIQGPWVNWYYGGKSASDIPMHYRMNHFVVAREYIGPRVG